MRSLFRCLLVVLSLFCLKPQAVALSPGNNIVVENDLGGSVYDYNQRFDAYNRDPHTVVISGHCVSACARFMLLDRVCAAPHASFYFHAITSEGTVQPELSERDSLATDTRAAFALEKKYDTFHMGTTTNAPYDMKSVEPGVSIVYLPIGDHLYQEFLRVDADKLIPPCRSERKPHHRFPRSMSDR